MQWKLYIPFDEYISNRCDIERIFQELENKYYAKILPLDEQVIEE